MVQYSYDRSYELIVSEPFQEADTTGQFLTNPLYNDYTLYKVAEDFRKVSKLRNVTISELHIECDINRDSKNGSNEDSATIKIYNLNKENEETIQKVGNYVVLNAGYSGSGSLPMIYSGQISDCYTEKQGEDLITTLICKDGYIPLNSVRISYVKQKGATYAEVINDIIDFFKANGVQKGEVILDPPTVSPFRLDQFASTIKLTRGFAYSGYARDALQQICESINYTWKIVNNAIYVYPKGFKNVSTRVEVSTSNILSVNKQRKGTQARSSNTAQQERGIQVTILLEGRANTSAKLIITDGDYKGTYKISSARHKLSYEGQQWYTILDCLET